MHPATHLRHRLFATAVGAALAVSAVIPVGAATPRSAADMRAGALQPTERIAAAKSPSSQLARTDPALLKRTDAATVNVIVKLDYDSVATYAGGIRGLAATSPKVTGKPLNKASRADRAYRTYIKGREDAFIAALRKSVPTARVGSRINTVYGGVAARIPARSVEAILKIKGVVAVQYDALRKLTTDSSPSFIGADPVYDQLATTASAGKGVIFGDLDSGVWPEHPSFEDQGNLSAPPAPARTCDFGDNPLTPATDVFVCNHKLIGGQAFLDTYLSDPTRAGDEPFDTARDSNGHGTHTTSTTAGNILDSAPVLGVERGPIHGIAPGAWVMEYKVCGIQGCFSSDSAAAVGQAIYDGVDVINYSISGGSNPFVDAVELGVPRRLPGRDPRVGLGRQLRPRRRHDRSRLTVGHDGRRIDPDAPVLVAPHGHRRWRELRCGRCVHHAGRRTVPDRAVLGGTLQRQPVRGPCSGGHLHRQDRGLSARRQRPRRQGLQRRPG